MNYKKIILVLFVGWSNSMVHADNLVVTNNSSDEITIIIQTAKTSYTQTLLARENQVVNTLLNSVRTSRTISYDNTGIISIIIRRISTNMPQIIYNNGQTTTDKNHNPIGMYNLNMGRDGTMNVLQDMVTINKKNYAITDLTSAIVQCHALQSKLSVNNLDQSKQQLDTLDAIIKEINASDKADEMQFQMIALQKAFDDVVNTIKLIKNIQKNIQVIDTSIATLSSTTIDQGQKTLMNMQSSLQALRQSNLQGLAFEQAQVLQARIQTLINALERLGLKQQGLRIEMLVPYETETAQYKNQINQMMEAGDMQQPS